MQIIYPYSPLPKYAVRQQDARRFLEKARETYAVTEVECTADRADTNHPYERQLKALWGQDDLMVFEQDVSSTLRKLAEMEACEQPVCQQAYELHKCFGVIVPGTDNQVICVAHHLPYYAWRVETADKGFRWGRRGDRFADAFCLSTTKFSRQFQQTHEPNWDPGGWHNLDIRISRWAYNLGVKAHLHYPEARHADTLGEAHNLFRLFEVDCNPVIEPLSPEWISLARSQVKEWIMSNAAQVAPGLWSDSET